jgi:hypothetical protein
MFAIVDPSLIGGFVDFQITANLRPFTAQPPVAQPATTMTSAGGAQ